MAWKELTQIDIQQWVGQKSFQRGLGYFHSGAIYNTRRQGDVLKARSRGSYDAYYLVEVTLGSQGLVTDNCSCPVGWRCKHVAALLLTWLDDHDSFLEVAELQTSLEQRSKEELITLIQHMLLRAPELKSLLEIPLPTAGSSVQPLDTDVIYRQVQGAFDVTNSRGWYDLSEIGSELRALCTLADQYNAQGEYSHAVVIYQQILDAALEFDEAIISDESGLLSRILSECAEDLGHCLEHFEKLEEREQILETLFKFYIWDLSQGGYGFANEVPIIFLEQASEGEKQTIISWVERVLPEMRAWARPTLGILLLDLHQEMLDDETFLRICRETNRQADLVNRLLELDRFEDAIQETRQADDYDLLQLADLFVQHDQAAQAEALVRERQLGSKDTRLTTWLLALTHEQDRLVEALELAEKLFWQRPSLDHYRTLRELAEEQKCWTSLRAATLTKLEQDGQFNLLTEIYLEEGQIDLALDALEKGKNASRHWWARSLQIQVAQAAREKRPHEAIRQYLEESESLIHHRGRENYASAAVYLTQVRNLYKYLKEPLTWEKVIADLRERHRSLPALKDELRKAGL